MAWFSNDDDQQQPQQSIFSEIGSFLWSAVKWLAVAALAVTGVMAAIHYFPSFKNWLDKVSGDNKLGSKGDDAFVNGTDYVKEKINQVAEKFGMKPPCETAEDRIVREAAEKQAAITAAAAAKKTSLEKTARRVEDIPLGSAVIVGGGKLGLDTAGKVGSFLTQRIDPVTGKPIVPASPSKLAKAAKAAGEEYNKLQKLADDARKLANDTQGLTAKTIEKNELAARKAENAAKAAADAYSAAVNADKAAHGLTTAATAENAAATSTTRARQAYDAVKNGILNKGEAVAEGATKAPFVNGGLVKVQSALAPVEPYIASAAKFATPAIDLAGKVFRPLAMIGDTAQTARLAGAGEYAGATQEAVNTGANLLYTSIPGAAAAEIIQDSNAVIRHYIYGKDDVSAGVLGTATRHLSADGAEAMYGVSFDKKKNADLVDNAYKAERAEQTIAALNNLTAEQKAAVRAWKEESKSLGLKTDELAAVDAAAHHGWQAPTATPTTSLASNTNKDKPNLGS